MPDARLALFQAVDVTSIINGAELRQTKVWPGISAPFCILFATNKVPGVGAGFRLINPKFEKSLNDAGVMRIDANDADIIPTRQLSETPEILKILFRGTKADQGLIERIRAQGHPTLEAFWREAIGISKGNHLRGSGNGFQKLRYSSRTRKKGDGLPGCDASYLHGLPKIDKDSFTSISINTQNLEPFSEERIHDPRSPEIFAGPLLVVRESVPAADGRINVAIVEKSAVFSTTFYGYSPIEYPAAKELIRYLAMVLGSKFTLWMVLLTSGKFGFERETVEKTTLDQIPIPDFRNFTHKQRLDIKSKFKALRTGKVSWDDVDEWVTHIYGLGSRDLQVISDTLEFNLPFAANREKAQAVPGKGSIKRFCVILRKELAPWAERFGSYLAIDPVLENSASPWCGISIQTAEKEKSKAISTSEWEGLHRVADREAATEVLIFNKEGELLVGRLAQRRYWSDTQARLLAQRIIWSHLDFLKGHIA